MHLWITRKEVNCSRRNLPVYSFLPDGTLVSMVGRGNSKSTRKL